ncbi:MAG: M23 family metallopeptidase [Myxococcota bacterium]|nr:M23 family metallopeptidase [Myxococcota bacterium]
MIRVFTAIFAVLICFSSIAASQRPTWQRRIGQSVTVRHKLARQDVTPAMWPPEPPSPALLDSDRFRTALSTLCGPMPEARLTQYSRAIEAHGRHFEIDPFLLGALMVDQSGCRPRTPDREPRRGVTRIDLDMHAPHIRGKTYRFYLKRDGIWELNTLFMDKYPFNKWKAEKIDANLYFAAAILNVFSKQCRDLDTTFNSVPHRHPISHWFFGDRVRHTEPEDRVLTIRRRLLSTYRNAAPEPMGNVGGIEIVSPLDGAPRVVLDYFGNKRGKKGDPGHRGIDLDGTLGEPVRAAAAGSVTFAGVDLPGQGKSRPLTPSASKTFPKAAMGPGGLYVHIKHDSQVGSIYMHLHTINVSTGDPVTAGQIIGTLGRTGTRTSGPHLHFELRKGTDRIDPAPVLKNVLVNPFS